LTRWRRCCYLSGRSSNPGHQKDNTSKI